MSTGAGEELRLHVLRLLRDFEKSPGRDSEYFQRELRRSGLSARDTGLALKMALGTIQMRRTLDYLIRHFSDVPTNRIRKDVIRLLRIGLYQILYLDRVPDFASVNSTVSLVKRLSSRKAGAFANAILRNIIRSIRGRAAGEVSPSASVCYGASSSIVFSKEIFPSPAQNMPRYLSVVYSHPLWIVKKWLREYSKEQVVSILRSDNSARGLYFWINKERTGGRQILKELSEAGVTVASAGPDGLYHCDSGTLRALMPYLDRGMIYIQDKTPYEICRIASGYTGSKNLDICAGPGGKSLCLSSFSKGDASFVCVEPDEERFNVLKSNIERMGFDSITALRNDAFSLGNRYEGYFDFVIADVPCCNSGVLSRRVSARWRLNKRTLEVLINMQKQITMKSLDYLKPGGYLVYSTCSIEREENSELVLYLKRKYTDISITKEKPYLPAEDSGDGGYVAVMQKSR